ncbi:MAG TPA: DUF6000 family protein [Polyangiaceae bacterium]|nr:DUF6000 family protein [Polyangiaceae bacterium]
MRPQLNGGTLGRPRRRTVALEKYGLQGNYYLTRKDLWFEQCDVLAIVTCLDERNGTEISKRYEALWRDYSRDKPNLRLEAGIVHIRRQLEALEALAAATNTPRNAG